MTKPMKLTPMLEQYFEIKRQVPDAIVFYRMGDFFEMFFEDAERAAPILDLVLTARGKGSDNEAPMCGVPHHSADQHIAKLVRHGFRVAICEQMEDPAQAKGIVRRDIVRIVTPGTAIESALIDREHCYLLALAPKNGSYGAAWLDVSTGDFAVASYDRKDTAALRDDLSRYSPREIIFPKSETVEGELSSFGVPFSPVDDSYFDPRSAHELLTRHFSTQSLRGFGLEEGDLRVAAGGGALRYATASHRRDLTHVSVIRLQGDDDFLELDASTLQNLEIFESREIGRAKATLWGVINTTRSGMGARTLRQWICRPLRDRERIFERHDAVEELVRNRALLDAISATLARIADLDRLTSRITLGSATPPECWSLSRSLEEVRNLREATGTLASPLHRDITARLDPLERVSARIAEMLEESAPVSTRDGGVIKRGVNLELDELRTIAHDAKTILLRIEANERERTGISSLKIRFNSVFGYYIEISKSNLAKVPVDYIRKQTLVNAERYITPELKELEEKIVGAEEKSLAIESSMYQALLSELGANAASILAVARAVGELDVLVAFAGNAVKRRYVRPKLSERIEICIDEGRHPVIETLTTERFIANETDIDRERNAIQIITGPNMGGKSTYLRQVALIALMNQIGSFVPAKSATLGLFDRIFTRVGASDNLARGESTFMVEMHETANILNRTSNDSLIILDEVGRGTATFDGLSLAWAIVEYLHDTPGRNAITLFATHYHELTDLAKTRARVENWNVSVKEWNDQIIFLRKLVRGAADKSYGLQVAKLAGIPQSVIRRAREILATLERKERDVVEATQQARAESSGARSLQMSLFSSREREILSELAVVEVESLTPIEALNKLAELKRILTES